MHQQKKGARQPQRSFLPSIRDHHAWQLWGTGLKTGSGSRVSSFKKRKFGLSIRHPRWPPPFDGRATTQVKTCREDGYLYSATCLGAVPMTSETTLRALAASFDWVGRPHVTTSPTNGHVACVCRPRLGASSLHCLCHCSALHAQESVFLNNAP